MSGLKKQHGFTLMEIMVVLGLTSVILYSVSLLTQKTLGTLNFLRSKSESTLSATLGCERLSSEMRETISTPSTGDTTSFTKVRASAPTAVGNDQPPLPPPAPPPPPGLTPSHLWTRAYSGTQLYQVTYSAAAGELRRQVDTGPTVLVASSVNDFDVDTVSGRDKTFQITLAVTESRRVATYRAVVFCPGAP